VKKRLGFFQRKAKVWQMEFAQFVMGAPAR
jgi:hypothetical protein